MNGIFDEAVAAIEGSCTLSESTAYTDPLIASAPAPGVFLGLVAPCGEKNLNERASTAPHPVLRSARGFSGNITAAAGAGVDAVDSFVLRVVAISD